MIRSGASPCAAALSARLPGPTGAPLESSSLTVSSGAYRAALSIS